VEQRNVSPPNFADWQAQSSTFEQMAYWTGPSDFNLVTEVSPEKVRESYASSSLFRVLRVEPQLGRGFLPEEDREKGQALRCSRTSFGKSVSVAIRRCLADHSRSIRMAGASAPSWA